MTTTEQDLRRQTNQSDSGEKTVRIDPRTREAHVNENRWPGWLFVVQVLLTWGLSMSMLGGILFIRDHCR